MRSLLVMSVMGKYRQCQEMLKKKGTSVVNVIILDFPDKIVISCIKMGCFPVKVVSHLGV